jgi:hypothetical protein
MSAAALGAALGAIGAILGAPWGREGVALVILTAAAYTARELFGAKIPLPNLHRQVPEWWRTFFSPTAASFLYGLGLGVGFLTYLSFGTLVAVAIAASSSGDPAIGALVMAPFGVARGLSVLVAGPATTTGGVARVIHRLDALALSRIPRRVNGLALTAIVVVAIAGIGGAGRISGTGLGAAVLAVVFAAAAASKLARPSAWSRALEGYRLGALQPATKLGVPIAELAVPTLVLMGRTRMAAELAVVLLVGFSAAILRVGRTRRNRVPCGCFGRTKTRSIQVLLGRNAVFAALATLVIAAPRSAAAPAGLRAPAGAELLPAALALGGALLAFLLVRTAASLIRPQHRD